VSSEAPWQLRDGNAVVAEWVNWKHRRVVTTGVVAEIVDGAVVIEDVPGGRRTMIDLTRITDVAVVTEGLDARAARREAMLAIRGAADVLKAREFDVGAFTRALSGVVDAFTVGQ
jgi:predicted thioredoxin/glutaredoxin